MRNDPSTLTLNADGSSASLAPSPRSDASTALTSGTISSHATPHPVEVRPATLAEAYAFVRERDLMPPARLAEVAGAINVLARGLGRTADKLPAAPELLTPLIENSLPAARRIKPKRWQNAVSLIRALLRACDLHAPPMAELPLSTEWVRLVDAMPDGLGRSPMLGFTRWCTASGIQPQDVTEATLGEYGDFRRTRTIRTYLRGLVSSIGATWNHCVRAGLPGWPQRLLVGTRLRNVDALPLSCFPASFQQHLAACLFKRTDPDAFDAHHNTWRPATGRSVRRFLIWAASLMARQLGGPEHVKSLGDIVTPEAAEFILRQVYERSGKVWPDQAATYATNLLMVARDFVKVDPIALERIEELRRVIMRRLKKRRRGLSERVSHRLVPLDDPKTLRRLFQLPEELYRIARKLLERQPVCAARAYERGLMLDILRRDPMRRFNLAGINYLEDFKRDERGRIVRLWISGDAVKNGIAIDDPIPPDLAKCLHEHWTIFRPHLRGSQSPWLFPSPKGAARSADNVTKAVGTVVRRMIGIEFTPHMMRHVIATQLYRTDPHNGVVVQRMLRHTNVKVTERAYGVMSNAGASETWQRELEKFIRSKVIASRQPPRRRSSTEDEHRNANT